MGAFKVINVEPHVREWTPSDGSTMHVDRLTLQNGDQAPVICEQNRKPETPSFSIGDEANGDIKPASDPKYLPTFKKARAGGFGGGGPRPPEEIAGARRAHSQEMALRYCEIQMQRGKLPQDWSIGPSFWQLCDRFDEDVKQVAATATPQTSPVGNAGASADAPPDESGMTEEKKDGDDIPF